MLRHSPGLTYELEPLCVEVLRPQSSFALKQHHTVAILRCHKLRRERRRNQACKALLLGFGVQRTDEYSGILDNGGLPRVQKMPSVWKEGGEYVNSLAPCPIP